METYYQPPSTSAYDNGYGHGHPGPAGYESYYHQGYPTEYQYENNQYQNQSYSQGGGGGYPPQSQSHHGSYQQPHNNENNYYSLYNNSYQEEYSSTTNTASNINNYYPSYYNTTSTVNSPEPCYPPPPGKNSSITSSSLPNNTTNYYNPPPVNLPVPLKPPVEKPQSQSPSWERALKRSKILHKILTYLPPPKLPEVCGVCKKWNSEGRKILGSKLTISFNSAKDLREFMKLKGDNNSSSKESGGFFFRKFRFGRRLSLYDKNVKDFLTLWGPWVKSLHLESGSLLVQTLVGILQQLGNLEELVIPSRLLLEGESFEESLPERLKKSLKNLRVLEVFGKPEEKNGAALYLVFKEFLRMAPNLQEIKVRKDNDPEDLIQGQVEIDDKNYTKFLNKLWDFEDSTLDTMAFNALLESKFAQSIRNLRLNIKLNSDCVQSLKSKGFPLRDIDLNISPQLGGQVLQDFLVSVKETLVNLKINYCGGIESDVPLMTTTPLSKVKKVTLQGYQGSLRFTERLPNLKELTLIRINFTKVVLKDVDLNEGTHGSLESFKVYDLRTTTLHRQRAIQSVQKLGMQFLHLRALRLEKLTDESLCLVWGQWPNLEDLEIVKGQFTDCGTTSIHPNAYKVILREGSYDSFNVEKLRQGLFIGSLQKLKYVKVHSPNVTDVTVILGLLHCPNLRNVEIESYQITDSSLLRLANSTNPTISSIATKNCNQLTPEVRSYVWKKVVEDRGGSVELNRKEERGMKPVEVLRFFEKYPQPRVTLKRVKKQGPPLKGHPVVLEEILPKPLRRRRPGRPRKPSKAFSEPSLISLLSSRSPSPMTPSPPELEVMLSPQPELAESIMEFDEQLLDEPMKQEDPPKMDLMMGIEEMLLASSPLTATPTPPKRRNSKGTNIKGQNQKGPYARQQPPRRTSGSSIYQRFKDYVCLF